MSPRQPQPFAEAGDFDQALVVYCTLGCTYCVMLHRMLAREGIEFVDVNVTSDRRAREWLHANTGETSIPQVFLHGRSVGGYGQLESMISSGELRAVLAARPDGDART